MIYIIIIIVNWSLTKRFAVLPSVNCPIGTAWSSVNGSCELCPVGGYQSLEAQAHCEACPDGLSTAQPGATNYTHCLGTSLFVCMLSQTDAETDHYCSSKSAGRSSSCFKFSAAIFSNLYCLDRSSSHC